MQMQVSLILYVFRQEKAGVSQYYGGGGQAFLMPGPHLSLPFSLEALSAAYFISQIKKPKGPENLSDMESTWG